MASDITVRLNGDNSDYKAKMQESASIGDKFTSGLSSGLQNLQQYGRNLSASIGEVGASFVAGFGAVAIVQKVVSIFTEAIENVKRLSALSHELQIDPSQIQAFEKAVKKTNGTVEEAAKVWEKARLSVDDLREGSDTAAKSFAKLGLTAADFQGLSLDESLEKIARAYVSNSDKAGAYSGVIEILGKRNVPQLMEAITALGTKGFAGLQKDSDGFFTSINSDGISAINTFARNAMKPFTWLKNGVANVFAGILETFQIIGGLGAAGWNWVMGVKTDWDAVLLMGQKHAEVIKQQNESLGAQKKAMEEINAEHKKSEDLYESLHEKEIASLDIYQRQIALKKEISDRVSFLLNTGLSQNTIDETNAEIAKRRNLLATDMNEIQKATTLDFKQQTELSELQAISIKSLTTEERIRLDTLKLIYEQKSLEGQINTMLAVPAAKRTELERDNLTLLIAQDQVLKKQIASKESIGKSALKNSNDDNAFLILQAKGVNNLTDEERLRYDQHKLITKELQLQAQIDDLLAIPIKDRTELEKEHLRKLISQDETMHKQIQTKTDLITLSENHLSAEKQLTTEYEKQQKNLKAAIDASIQWEAKADPRTLAANLQDFGGVKITNYSEQDLNNLAPDVLRKIIAQQQSGISTLQSGKGVGPSAGAEAASNYFFRDSAISLLQKNIDLANSVINRNNSLSGKNRTDALGGYTGDLLNFDQNLSQANGQNNQQATQSNTLLTQLNAQMAAMSDQLARSGLFPKTP